MTIRITHEQLSEARAAEREAMAEERAYKRAEQTLEAAVRAIRDAGEERYLSAETRAQLGEMGENVQRLLDDAVVLARGARRVATVVSKLCDDTEELPRWDDVTQSEHDTLPAPAMAAAE